MYSALPNNTGVLYTLYSSAWLCLIRHWVSVIRAPTLPGTDPEDVIRNAFACFDEEGTGKIHEDRWVKICKWSRPLPHCIRLLVPWPSLTSQQTLPVSLFYSLRELLTTMGDRFTDAEVCSPCLCSTLLHHVHSLALPLVNPNCDYYCFDTHPPHHRWIKCCEVLR